VIEPAALRERALAEMRAALARARASRRRPAATGA
jgi:hypothetical protein